MKRRVRCWGVGVSCQAGSRVGKQASALDASVRNYTAWCDWCNARWTLSGVHVAYRLRSAVCRSAFTVIVVQVLFRGGGGCCFFGFG